jgi:hypothetical protein
MKNLFTLFLTLSLFSTSAMANGTSGLAAAYDDFNYAITIEWDQSNQAFYQLQKDTLTNHIAELQNNGLTKAEMFDFVISRIKNKKTAAEVTQLFQLIDTDQLSESQTIEMIDSIQNSAYESGASWSGRTTLVSVGALVLIGVVVLAVKAASKTKRDQNLWFPAN